MERMYAVTVFLRGDSIGLKLVSQTGDREYFLTSGDALQLSFTLEAAVEQVHRERFEKLPTKAIGCKSGDH